MTREQYLAEFKSLTDQMYETTKAKNHDYTADSADPFKNFKMINEMGVCSVEAGFLTRITDKVMRIAGFVKTGILKVADEKVEDTLLDLATYCLLMVCYLRQKNNEQPGLASDSSSVDSNSGFDTTDLHFDIR